jgi:hypothetical protein
MLTRANTFFAACCLTACASARVEEDVPPPEPTVKIARDWQQRVCGPLGPKVEVFVVGHGSGKPPLEVFVVDLHVHNTAAQPLSAALAAGLWLASPAQTSSLALAVVATVGGLAGALQLRILKRRGA